MSEVARLHFVRDAAFTYEPRDWPWADQESARIDTYWRARVAANPALFDGPVLLLHRCELASDIVRGAFLRTRFSRFLAWRDFDFPDRSVRNCFAMAALRAEDGGFLLAIMGRHTANPGKIYFPAGTPDPDDIVADRVDLAGSLLRELAEETGLAPSDVEAGEGWTLVEVGQRLALMRSLTVSGAAEEVQARLEANIAVQAAPELAGIAIVRNADDIARHAAAMPSFILAYLRRELGLF